MLVVGRVDDTNRKFKCFYRQNAEAGIGKIQRLDFTCNFYSYRNWRVNWCKTSAFLDNNIRIPWLVTGIQIRSSFMPGL